MQENIHEILKNHRSEIDHLDDEIVSLIALRLGVIDRVAKIKCEKNIEPRLQDRVAEVIKRNRSMANILGADADLIEQLYTQIVENAIIRETVYIEQHKKS